MSSQAHRRPDISIVLPCHNGTALAHSAVTTIRDYLSSSHLTWELVVVDDGLNQFEARPLPLDPRIRIIRHPRNLGKGTAVRHGMLAAGGHTRIYTDVDLPYDLDLILLLHSHIQHGYHLAIGDRTMAGAEYLVGANLGRRVVSSLASRFIGSLVTGGFHDTQCGLKAVRGDVADALFPLVTISGFAFDVEVIYVALKHHLDIKRVPVQLRNNAGSSVRVLRDSARSLVDILGIKSRQLRGRYASPELERLVVREAELARREAGALIG